MGVSTKVRPGKEPSDGSPAETRLTSPLEQEKAPDAPKDATGIEDLLAQHLPMIEGIARHFASTLPTSIAFDDLVVAGALGFMEAVERYDASLGVPLRHYASIRVRGAIQDELRNLDWMPRSIRQTTTQLDRLSSVIEHQNYRHATDADLAGALGVDTSCFRGILAKNPVHQTVSLDELDSGNLQPIEKRLWDLAARAPGTPPSKLETAALGEELILAMDDLNDQQQMVTQLYYFGELTMREIGEVLGLSQGRISQIHAQSLDILRKRMEDLEKEPTSGN